MRNSAALVAHALACEGFAMQGQNLHKLKHAPLGCETKSSDPPPKTSAKVFAIPVQ
jgi:hypothetical protein